MSFLGLKHYVKTINLLYIPTWTTAAHNFSSQKIYIPSGTFYFVFTDAQFLLQIILNWHNTDQKKDLLSSAVNNCTPVALQLSFPMKADYKASWHYGAIHLVWTTMRNNYSNSILQMRALELVKLFTDFNLILPPNSEHGLKQTNGSNSLAVLVFL